MMDAPVAIRTRRGVDGSQRLWSVASFSNGEVEVIGTRLDVSSGDVEASLALLSPVERQRAGRFTFDRDRSRYIVGRAWLRRLLSARLDLRPDAIELLDGAHGKPYLAGQCAAAKLHFNVSHTHDIAVYAFSRGLEVGVDIEFVRAMSDADDVARNFFSPRECAEYFALSPHDRPLGFFNGWTRKEAFIKAIGDGLGYPLDRFDVTLGPDEPARILRVEDTVGARCGWTLHSLAPGPGLVGAVVVQTATEDSVRTAMPGRIQACTLPMSGSTA